MFKNFKIFQSQIFCPLIIRIAEGEKYEWQSAHIFGYFSGIRFGFDLCVKQMQLGM